MPARRLPLPIAVVPQLVDYGVMSDDNLTWLASWYLAECNDDWEHSYGVKIDTLDNPGWTLVIDLEDTNLERRTFEKVSMGEPASNLSEWRRLGSWWVAEVTGGKFQAACGPLDLGNVVGVFRSWVEQANGS
jgi:hypothetical protein